MKIILNLLVVVIVNSTVIGQKVKFDTTLKLGSLGYRVTSSNKNLEKNTLAISLIGFEENRSDLNLGVKGKVEKAEMDDLNKDGLPDLLIYIFEGEQRKGSVFAIVCQEKKTVAPVIFPDIMDDTKLRIGYEGKDEFRLMNGILMRRFPIVNNSDSTNTQAKTIRQILYKVVPGENGILKFKVDRTVDVVKP